MQSTLRELTKYHSKIQSSLFTWYGVVLRSDSASAWKIMQIRSLKSWFDQTLKESIFCRFVFSLFVWVLSGISRSGSIKIERSMKKYPQGLILRFFRQMGSPNSSLEPPQRTPPGGPPWKPPWGRKLLRFLIVPTVLRPEFSFWISSEVRVGTSMANNAGP